MIGRIADRHLGRSAALGVLLALAVLLSLDVFFSVIAELGDLGKGRYSFTHILGYVALTLPRRAYDLFPVATVVGTLLGIGGLAAGSELVAYRAAGLSRLRIALGVVLSTALILVPMLGVGELLAPTTERMAQALRVGAQSEELAVAGDASIWVRDGERFINARRPLVSASGRAGVVTLVDINVFEFEAGRLASMAHAGVAVHDGADWMLRGIRRSTLQPDGVRVETAPEEHWSSLIDPAILATAVARPRHLALAELAPYIDYLERNGLDSGAYRSAFWARIAYPVTALVIVFAGMPFVFSAQRSGGLGQRLFVGMLLGVGFYLANRIAVNIGEVYRVDPALMAFAPSLLLVALAVLALRRGV